VQRKVKENIPEVSLLLERKKVVLYVSRITSVKMITSGHALLVMKDAAFHTQKIYDYVGIQSVYPYQQ